MFGRLCRQKDHWVESRKAFSRVDWETNREKLEDNVEKARQGKDRKAFDTAKAKLEDYRKEKRDMEREIKNSQVHYERSLFHLGVTLAHECFHVLTGLWTGDFEVGTPYKLGGAYAGKDPEQEHGEAGDWWEYQSGFNGSVNLVWGKDDPKKDDPHPLKDESLLAGIPFVRQLRYKADGSSDGAAWTRISHAYIKDVINKGEYTSYFQGCVQAINDSSIGLSNKSLYASDSREIKDSEFNAGFASVTARPSTKESSATAPGRAAKGMTATAPAKLPQRGRTKPARGGVPLRCKECPTGSHTVPLGCRGPKATEGPRA